MWPFKQRLTSLQNKQIQRRKIGLNEVTRTLQGIITDLMSVENDQGKRLYELYMKCHTEIQPGTHQILDQAPTGVDALIDNVRNDILSSARKLSRLNGQLLRFAPANWYTKEYRSAYASLQSTMDGIVRAIDSMVESLNESAPLSVESPEKHRVNMLVHGYRSIYTFLQRM